MFLKSIIIAVVLACTTVAHAEHSFEWNYCVSIADTDTDYEWCDFLYGE